MSNESGIFGKLEARSLKLKATQGFSIVELLVVLVIAGLVAAIVMGAFSTATGREALDKEADVVLSLLSQARGLTLSAKGASVYGVHFESAKAVLFSGSTYSASALSNKTETINPPVLISSVSLSGGGNEVVFNRLSGETAKSGTVTLSLVASSTQTKVITIFATGVAQSN